MKTMIFVCGNSQIEYINSSESIKSIPVILSFSDEEHYNDTIDITAQAFYNRLTYDKKAKVKIRFQNFVTFCDYVETARNNGYEQILFILGAKEYGDIFVPTMLVKSQFSSLPIYIFSSKAISYPLAQMAISADKLFAGGANIDQVLDILYEKDTNYQMYFYAPKTDVKYVHYRNFLVGSKMVLPRKNTAYKFDGTLQEFSAKGRSHILFHIFNEIKKNLSGNRIFLLYSDKSSDLYKCIKQYILTELPEIKEIDSYPIPPAIGLKLGVYAVGIGLVPIE